MIDLFKFYGYPHPRVIQAIRQEYDNIYYSYGTKSVGQDGLYFYGTNLKAFVKYYDGELYTDDDIDGKTSSNKYYILDTRYIRRFFCISIENGVIIVQQVDKVPEGQTCYRYIEFEDDIEPQEDEDGNPILGAASTGNQKFKFFIYDGTLTDDGRDVIFFTASFYDYLGQVLSQQVLKSGSTIRTPDSPTRTGYNFIGWDRDYSTISANIDISAEYDPIHYTVHFDGNGSSEGSVDDQVFTYDISQELNENKFKKQIVTNFDKNYDGATSMSPITSNCSFYRWSDGISSLYRNGQEVENLSYVDDDIVNLSATWNNPQISLPNLASIENFNLAGWFDRNQFGLSVGSSGTAYTVGDSGTLYAHWLRTNTKMTTITKKEFIFTDYYVGSTLQFNDKDGEGITGNFFEDIDQVIYVRYVETSNSVTEIGQNSFAYCTNLENVICPSVISINNNAFRNCSKLKYVSFSEKQDQNIPVVMTDSFLNCSNVKIIVPDWLYETWTSSKTNGTWQNLMENGTVQIVKSSEFEG